MKPTKPMPALIGTVCDTVRQSMENLCQNEPGCNSEVLTADLVSAVSRVLQQSLMDGARAGLAQFIESFDTGQETIMRAGKPFRFKEVSAKTFLTIFGPVEIKRSRYCYWGGGPSVVPLDEYWNMSGRYATPEVTEHLLLAAAMLPVCEVEELVGRLTPCKPSASLIQDIINQDGAALTALLNQEEHLSAMRPAVQLQEPAPTSVVVSMDGVNVLMREAGRKAGRPAERPRAGDDESTSCSYRNAMVGAISFYREIDNVINIDTGAEARLSERIGSIYHARMPEPGSPTFKREFEHLVSQNLNHLDPSIPRILLMDGARSLWNYATANPLYKGFRMLVDFYHASEHLSALAEALFGKQSDKARKWYEKWRHKLKYEPGAITGLLRSSGRFVRLERVSGNRLQDARKELGYFRRNQERMNYHEYIDQGLPIGSGPVEAACKTIVKARMAQSGMRWSHSGGQNVLSLRTLNKSRQWDSAWAHYQRLGGYHYATHVASASAAA